MSSVDVGANDTASVDLAVVIVNYRTPSLTLDCLASLESEIDPSMRVVVVDNASSDGSAELIERAIDERGWSPWVRLLRSRHNGGFAAGNNQGILSVKAEAYVLLNSDTIVQRGAFVGLRKAMLERPEAGIIGPGLLDAQGDFDQSFFREPTPPSELIRSSNTGLIGRWLRRFDPILPRSEGPIEVDWLGFACVLVRRAVIDDVGLLDEDYFMYFEDIDFCRRVRAAGWKVLYWPEPKIVHLQGGSSKVSSEDALLRRAPRYYYEARARYFAKFHGRRGLWLANAFWYLGRCVSLPRELVGHGSMVRREYEHIDLWTNALQPLRKREAHPEARS